MSFFQRTGTIGCNAHTQKVMWITRIPSHDIHLTSPGCGCNDAVFDIVVSLESLHMQSSDRLGLSTRLVHIHVELEQLHERGHYHVGYYQVGLLLSWSLSGGLISGGLISGGLLLSWSLSGGLLSGGLLSGGQYLVEVLHRAEFLQEALIFSTIHFRFNEYTCKTFKG